MRSNLSDMNKRLVALSLLVIAAVASRFIPHLPNFTPIAAIALFGGVYFTDKRLAIIIPLLAMFISDLVIGLHDTLIYVYASFAIIALLGVVMKSKLQTPWTLPVLSVFSSLLFYTITNFGVWASGILYPQTADGLGMAYLAGLPFLKYSLAGDAFYILMLFGGWALLQNRVPELRVKFA